MDNLTLRILETPEEMEAVENLQRQIWTGNETEIVPKHLLIASARSGGLIMGAFSATGRPFTAETQQPWDPESGPPLIGFVFGFPGIYFTPDGPRLKHTSHMLGVHPEHRSQGVGFLLKRAQWQMVRKQGVDRITWTYDPLMGANAHLNITRLGAVCNTYRRDYYGSLNDGLNAGLPSDRFEVDWWVNSKRVNRRLSRKPRLRLDLAHFLSAESEIINPSQMGPDGMARPGKPRLQELLLGDDPVGERHPLLLMEIPADFQAMKRKELELAGEWRQHSRQLFEELFAHGYLVTDFIYLPGITARSFYVMSHGESTF